jgi:hypothetical protein
MIKLRSDGRYLYESRPNGKGEHTQAAPISDWSTYYDADSGTNEVFLNNFGGWHIGQGLHVEQLFGPFRLVRSERADDFFIKVDCQRALSGA